MTNFIEELEGRVPFVYPDSKGLPSIGIGHCLTKSELSSGKIMIKGVPVKYSKGLTDQQIDDLYDQDHRFAVDAVNKHVKVTLTDNQFAALTSFVFNIGASAFANSTLLKKLNQGLYSEVPGQMRRWIYEDGKISNGLTNRREKEIQLWLKSNSPQI
jgi:lysozyme